MSDPRYRPRDFTLEAEGFGKATTILWDQSRPTSRLRASQIQHTYAIEIRRLAKATYGSIGAYASATGQSEDRLTKVLRGDAIMRLEDIATAQLLLGFDDTDAVATAGDDDGS